jgi:hypothetical protein
VKSIHNLTPPQQTVFKSQSKQEEEEIYRIAKKNEVKTTPHRTTPHVNITHLVLELLHRLELFYGKQHTSRVGEMR